MFKKKLIALTLVITMILPSVAYAGEIQPVKSETETESGIVNVVRNEGESLEDAVKRGFREAGYDESSVNLQPDVPMAAEGRAQIDISAEIEIGDKAIEVNPYVDEKGTLTPPIDSLSRTRAYTNLSVGYSYYGYISYPGEWVEYRFTPSVSGNYIFQSTGNTDTYGMLCTMNWYGDYLVKEDDDAGSGLNFSLEYYCNAGETYKLYVRHYSSSTSGYSFNVQVTNGKPALDSYYSPQGGSWTPNNGYVNISTYVYRICYWDRAKTSAEIIMLGNPAFGQEVVETFAWYGASAAAGKLASKIPYIGIYVEVASIMIPLYTSFMNYINYYSLYNAGNTVNGVVNNGVAVYSMSVNNVFVNVYEPWTGSTMYGYQDNMPGTFSTTNFTPMF